MNAYVDESIRRSESGIYLVAAAIVTDVDLDEARYRVRSVIGRGQPRFHWRDESEPQRRRMLEAIVELGPTAAAYVCVPTGRRQDRARALCIGRMLWDLKELGARHVTFESRQPHNDRKDARTIERAKRSGTAAAELRYVFQRPLDEPLLWVADALAGVASARMAGEPSELFDVLPDGFLSIETLAP
jgi:hypothetical protein